VLKLKHLTLNDRAYSKLKEALISGTFAPGEPLIIRKLAEAYGISTTPIREALQRLVAERVLEMAPNRSIVVPMLTATAFEELTTIRVATEGVAAERAAQLGEVAVGGGGQVAEPADLPGQLPQVGRVVACPAAHGAVGGAPVALGADPLVAGRRALRGGGAQPQIAALGRLPAGDAERGGQLLPAHALTPGRVDQIGFPGGELGAQLAQQRQRGQESARSGCPAAWQS